ncbi:MAG: YafY family transcriptional regulator [Gammaproteobacteria bacterium]|nr:YafY family transcriptional regulator [Gammaproteobacteria bacterium]
MERTHRIHKIITLLHQRRTPIPERELCEVLAVSRATVQRDIQYLRDAFSAPIMGISGRGYCFDPTKPAFELPGLWFTPGEAHALITLQQMLKGIEPGLLEPVLRPVQERIARLLRKSDHTLDEIKRRIRILKMGQRRIEPRYFELISHAVLARQRLFIHYYNRELDQDSQREISPQRLVHYRDNWYLDAYCHVKNGIRIFALECIQKVELREPAARTIADTKLDTELASSYGIFAGRCTQTAVLRFNAHRARWVAGEIWHPNQRGYTEPDGCYRLEIPYSDDRELLMDILKYGPEVEVLAPKNLRARVRQSHADALQHYQKPPDPASPHETGSVVQR